MILFKNYNFFDKLNHLIEQSVNVLIIFLEYIAFFFFPFFEQ